LGSALQSDLYELDYAKLKIQSISTLPLDASMILRFYDANGGLLLQKPLTSLLQSGTPNSDGVVITAKTTDAELVLNSTDFAAIVDAKEVVAEVSMSTFNGGSIPVKLRTDAFITLDIAVEAKVNYQL